MVTEEDWFEAGKRSYEVLMYAKDLIKEDRKIIDIINEIEDYCIKRGYDFAFPPQISINEIAAHFYPTLDDSYCIKKDDIVKIDLGIEYNGAIGDNAYTVQVSNKNKDLLDASRNALERVTSEIKLGMTLSEIGRLIQEEITKKGFKPIKNLSGHGLGEFKIHTPPGFPNYENGDKTKIKPGMRFAIEPFATSGKGLITHSDIAPTLFAISKQIKPVDPVLKLLYETIMDRYYTLPFAFNWLLDDFESDFLSNSLEKLEKKGVIESYEPLKEIKSGLVSQFEYSFIATDKGVFRTTK